jgi:hypothetical protein
MHFILSAVLNAGQLRPATVASPFGEAGLTVRWFHVVKQPPFLVSEESDGAGRLPSMTKIAACESTADFFV